MKYDENGKVINVDLFWIINFFYEGKLISLNQEFFVVINNYCVFGGGGFFYLMSDKIVYGFVVENR